MYDISSLVEYYYRARGPGHERNPVGVTTLKRRTTSAARTQAPK